MRSVFFSFVLVMMTGTPTRALIGGHPASSSSVVFLSSCTGTLIAPHIILTAGHCVLMPTTNGSAQPTFKPGQMILVLGFEGGTQVAFETRVKNVAVHPSWKNGLEKLKDADRVAETDGIFDLGVLILQGTLPLSPASLPPAEILRVDSKLEVFGAGCQDRAEMQKIGVLKSAPVSVDAVSASRVRIDTGGGRVGLCRRDSGGGGFISQEGKTYLVSVNSTLDGGNEVALEPRAVPGLLARLDRPEVRSWLERPLGLPVPQMQARRIERNAR